MENVGAILTVIFGIAVFGMVFRSMFPKAYAWLYWKTYDPNDPHLTPQQHELIRSKYAPKGWVPPS